MTVLTSSTSIRNRARLRAGLMQSLDFETTKCSRELPGFSDLNTANHQFGVSRAMAFLSIESRYHANDVTPKSVVNARAPPEKIEA